MGCICSTEEEQNELSISNIKVHFREYDNSPQIYFSPIIVSPKSCQSEEFDFDAMKYITKNGLQRMDTYLEEPTRENTKIPLNNISFNNVLYEEIVLLRKNPCEYANKIKKYIDYISKNTDNLKNKFPYYIEVPGSTLNKIYLKKGKIAFLECIDLLEGYYPLPCYSYKEELEISMPSYEDINSYFKRDVITQLINTKTKELGQNYKNYGFHFDQNITSSELSLVLQLVDDNNFRGQRRNNLLSTNFRYIGITNSDHNDKMGFCSYLNFAY